MAMMQFELFGHERVEVETAVVYVDHNILQIDFKNPDDHRFLQAMSAKYGAWFSRPGNGICHYIHCERFATPGKTLVGADSHTTQSGSAGMIAIGAGGLDVAVCMAGHPFELPCPKIVGVFLENELQRPWIQAKDVILELLRRRGVRGGRGAIFEFTGPGVSTLSYTERGTIANMIAELGATGAVFPADDETKAWFDEQERSGDFTALETGDAEGDFDEVEHIDLAALVPLVAKPSSPGNVVPVDELVGTPLAQVCVGSSVNSSYEDMAVVGVDAAREPHLREADLRDGDSRLAADPRPDHAVRDVRRPAVCGRADARAGLRAMRRHGPGASVGGELAAHLQPELPGPQRDGRRQRLPLLARGCGGVDAHGRDRRSARADRARAAWRARPRGRPSSRVTSWSRCPRTRRRSIEIPRGPNIKPPPEQKELPDTLELRVLIVAPDDISTGDLSPDGATVMAYRSNVPAIAEFTFQHRDPEFPRRAKEWGGGFIVAGDNYGQGSSREHAALAPAQLGVRAVIAKSFARIHRRNLIAQGIVPLLFKDAAGYDKAELGQTWRISRPAGDRRGPRRAAVPDRRRPGDHAHPRPAPSGARDRRRRRAHPLPEARADRRGLTPRSHCSRSSSACSSRAAAAARSRSRDRGREAVRRLVRTPVRRGRDVECGRGRRQPPADAGAPQLPGAHRAGRDQARQQARRAAPRLPARPSRRRGQGLLRLRRCRAARSCRSAAYRS